MGHYVCFDAAGRGLQHGYCLDGEEENQRPDAARTVVVEEETPFDQVYFDGEVRTRPASPVALEGLRLKNVPAPALIVIEGVTYLCTDSTVDLEFDHPGTYQVRVEAFPHLDAAFTVVVP